VVAVGEHGAAPPGGAVEVARRGDLEALHAAGELHAARRLDEEMDVRALDADVDDLEALLAAPRGDERLADRRVGGAAAKAV
jgi:hypothetical protein